MSSKITAPADYKTESILLANQRAAEHGIDLSKLPQLMDMNADTITDNVHAINANCTNDRMKFVFKSLIQHLHDFIRETSLTSEEWMTALEFLTKTGQISSDIRHEFILLSDVLGVSTLVDSLNHAKPPGATEACVLGPFFTEDAHHLQNGDSIATEGKGEYMYVHGKVLDTKGNPIPGATIDTWETDGQGLYDTQYAERTEPDCRGRLFSAEDGTYAFRAVVPVSYPIPSDGPVGKLVTNLGRHVFRPSHLHMQIEAQGFEKLTTAFYPRGDPYLYSDAVFGVHTSLIVDLKQVSDKELSLKRGFKEGKPHVELHRDIILATPEEGREARKKMMPAVEK
ncbi:intradiol ring-cleavage dioxygenase [Gymnopus androsaceus JB14]|uniref:Intradiol ring-cleavage dioxygenase n=1 Tax=Gymnopus androsaceus JB14 TaxID=1447944 RepID=A0A6A4IMB3_9AGAR|nr:intradiol ring-cleavage dioxygenase [Gymnopus androsaceus JB14]